LRSYFCNKYLLHVFYVALATSFFTGILEYSNGDIYDGEWANDQRHGRGKFVSESTGVTYLGDWREGMRHGQGSLYFPNNDYFVGKWTRGVVDGPVNYHFNDSSPWLDPEY
jgi:hypothetical protein